VNCGVCESAGVSWAHGMLCPSLIAQSEIVEFFLANQESQRNPEEHPDGEPDSTVLESHEITLPAQI
jgi:hypothetical protein